MNDTPNPFSIPMNQDDKIASLMFYLPHAIFWGEVAIRKQFRPSTWLSTNAVPDIIHLNNPKAIFESNDSSPKPSQLHEVMLPSNLILACHMVPPNFDPIDFDPTEPNMQMCPVNAFFGSYQFSGKLRISTKQSLLTYLEITRVTFLCLYEVVIQNMFMPGLGGIKVPFVLVRKEGILLNLIR